MQFYSLLFYDLTDYSHILGLEIYLIVKGRSNFALEFHQLSTIFVDCRHDYCHLVVVVLGIQIMKFYQSSLWYAQRDDWWCWWFLYFVESLQVVFQSLDQLILFTTHL